MSLCRARLFDLRHGCCFRGVFPGAHILFSLLTRLIGRLSVGRKLILIYALDLTAVIFVSGILINEKGSVREICG